MPIELTQEDIAGIVKNEDDVLLRAIYKWVRFMQAMWAQITDKDQERRKKRYEILGIVFRVVIISLSTIVTTVSDISEVPRTTITILAGILTAFTGIETYFRFSERSLSIQQQQREIQSLRDELRYRWMIGVELETDTKKRINSARDLLQNGPKVYNNILNKYVFKSKESDKAPEMTKG